MNQSQGFAEIIRNLYRQPNQTEADLNQAIVGHVLAVTKKYETDDLDGSRDDPAAYLGGYNDWFQTQLREVFPNNLGRKKNIQPLSFAFVDMSGSRGRKNISALELKASGLLHVHAVIAIRPGDGMIFRQQFLDAGKLKRFGDVKVTPFDPSLGSLENMFEYFKKGSDAIGSRCRADAYDIFPRFRTKSPSLSPDVSQSTPRSTKIVGASVGAGNGLR